MTGRDVLPFSGTLASKVEFVRRRSIETRITFAFGLATGFSARLNACLHSHPSIAMTTTTTKTTVAPTTTTKKTTITKAALKKMTAEKKRLGKTNMSNAGKKKAMAMKKKGLGIFAPKKLSDALAGLRNF